MKKILSALALLMLVGSANAQWHRGCCGAGWVAPAIVGGVIGYELARPQTVIVNPNPIVVQPQTITDPNLVVVNGVLYRKVMMQVNGVYQEVLVKP